MLKTVQPRLKERKKMSLFTLLLAICLCGLIYAMPHVNATASQCTRPFNTYSSSAKRSTAAAVALSKTFDFSQDILAAQTAVNQESDVSTLAATSLFSFGKLSAKAKQNVKMAPKHFTGKTGPLFAKIQNRIMEFTGLDETACVACRLNCLDAIPTFGTIFSECENQFYYYGCQKVAPCHSMSDGNVVLETAVGICLERNKCKLVDSLVDLQNTRRRIGFARRRMVSPTIDEIKKGVVSRVGQYIDNYNRKPFSFGKKRGLFGGRGRN
ncbi:hypothetical protein NAEGRDRAFT_59834 [Naegleria gruberi]|uniref:Uncharacterized protein n=1 Tax=Naegleria gruberi TaxID=5762 RepID=D2W1C4_NAEGR|nr:uncharacterized protein NAEGRDRAFT_59834 [Naegleria gruberi]EFC37161.1 hypothetical protein NAEGRDRAFT_59834 [Naegleria gruberi]|eukprot:XP_002669905.1 hypothetical protein NAEGRDRAFT_59834 [Naegleria gruberi strain NEG-M]